VCTENSVRIDLKAESLNVSTMAALLFFLLTLFASPFKSKSRLEAENAALRHQLGLLRCLRRRGDSRRELGTLRKGAPRQRLGCN
jgi:hypothetical protein